jgi:hypothetical protein
MIRILAVILPRNYVPWEFSSLLKGLEVVTVACVCLSVCLSVFMCVCVVYVGVCVCVFIVQARQVLDSNGSGGLTSMEFCAAMKKLVSLLCVVCVKACCVCERLS